MIEQLTVTNLKCFARLDLRLGALTLLAGLNSAGKSTVIQALLLDAIARRGGGTVPLSGEFGLAMGEAAGVLRRAAPEPEIRIETEGGGLRSVCRLGVPEDAGALALDVLPGCEWPEGAPELGAYLCAERLGPRDTLEIRASSNAGVGHQGQFVAQVLVQAEVERRRTPVPDARVVPGEVTESERTVVRQTEAWLSRIVRPIQLQAQRVAGSDLATLRFRDPALDADWTRPANVGFGLSYALPVVVAGLTVPAGSLFLVENPEAHLHPAGQSAMAAFLAQVAASGVQVVIETHSDHVVNGVRRAVVSDALIPAPDVAIHAFGEAGPTSIGVTDSGALTAWPEQFFDQIQKDLVAISRAARR